MRALADYSHVSPYQISTDDRLNFLEDPIVNETIRLISNPQAKDFKFYALSVTLHPKLKDAILAQLKRGLSVKVFTNGRQAQKEIVPIRIPFGWYLSLPDLDDISHSRSSGGRFGSKNRLCGCLSSSQDGCGRRYRSGWGPIISTYPAVVNQTKWILRSGDLSFPTRHVTCFPRALRKTGRL